MTIENVKEMMNALEKYAKWEKENTYRGALYRYLLNRATSDVAVKNICAALPKEKKRGERL